MNKPEQFIKKYESALSTQQWSEVEPLIHPNCTVTFSTGTVHKGKSEVEKAFTRNFRLIANEKYSISNVYWVIKSDHIAVLTYNYYWTGIINNEAVSGSGYGTSTIVTANKKWLLIAEHLGAV